MSTSSDHRAGDALYTKLSRRIVRGEIAPGVHLVEQELASAFRIGRTPVRAVLQRLLQDGLVIARGGPKARALVAPLSSAEMAELAAVLAALDGIASKALAIAPGSRRKAIVRQLRVAQRLFAIATRSLPASRDELFELHRGFHSSIIREARLPLVGQVRAPVATRMQRYEWIYGRSSSRAMTASVTEHRKVIDAIAAGDGDGAELAMRTNWTNAATRLRALLPS